MGNQFLNINLKTMAQNPLAIADVDNEVLREADEYLRKHKILELFEDLTPRGSPQATDQQFGAVNSGAGADRGALLVSLPVQVLDNGKLRVEQVELYERDDADDVARVFCINHRIGDPECAKLLEALKQRRAAAVGGA